MRAIGLKYLKWFDYHHFGNARNNSESQYKFFYYFNVVYYIFFYIFVRPHYFKTGMRTVGAQTVPVQKPADWIAIKTFEMMNGSMTAGSSGL
ncbi:hypothetical protein DSCO28_59130 [Desulfosarcina ovata subsp. sediminis]|uniref:Uncharacterized protein n=1 Tax=Desulfosarcina ovata subsp. sediminis TaxID=885957 RepID=A0A5K7ZYJ8_9BACT|nr:hypothetical protein DSCO28_59130 [Desulfosarcina ovata subsp. sediminis]